jgi:hypothetical protein
MNAANATKSNSYDRLIEHRQIDVAASAACALCDALRILAIEVLTLPRFHVHQTHAAFRLLRSKSAGDR